MAGNISLRKAGLDDLQPLQELMILTFQQAYAHLNDPRNFAQFMAETFNEKIIRQELEDAASVYWVISLPNGSLCAFVKLNFEKESTKFNNRRGVEVQRIYVHPDHQGLGLGALLLDKAKNEAKAFAAQGLWLGVWKKNPAAVRFYERHGFKKTGDHIFRLGEEDQEDWVLTYHFQTDKL